MAARVIKVPDIGEGIAEVELVEWLVKDGDAVAEDQPLAVVMTDKASVEVPSPLAGTVIARAGEPGKVLAVGAELIRIEPLTAGHGAAAIDETSNAVGGAASGAATSAANSAANSAPGDAALAAHAGLDKPLASPSVRRHARDRGIDLWQVPGSGPAGRVRHEDVERFAAQATATGPSDAAAPARARASAVESARAVASTVARTATGTAAAASAIARTFTGPRYGERHDEQAIPVIGLRRRIAEKMQQAKRHIPHFSYVEEVDVTELEALRAQLNAKRGAGRGRLTLLPFVLRAIVLAVREFPQVNARYDDEANVVTRYGAVHVGIATQTDAGLMVPVLRHAEALDLWATAAQIARLAQAARDGKALREELSGSTITVTSLGALGGIASTPVINHPEVAIVGVNRIVERPVVLGGAIVARRMMNLSSSFDHRVVDGMHGAEFVQALRGYLGCPATMFVD